jgi:hypothetical protein
VLVGARHRSQLLLLLGSEVDVDDDCAGAFGLRLIAG